MKKTNKPLFSIIIPVYNTSNYLKKCLDSVINAIDTDCEVIIINDGSTDESGNIIKEYLKQLPKDLKNNFIYKEKKNKGLADTKNLGIKLSRGKYISVVDSDDTISDNFYSDARKYVEEDYDIIIYDLYIKYEHPKEKEFDYIARAIREDKKGTLLDKIMNGAMQGSSCNKIIKKELYKYEFPVGKEYEDVAVTPFILVDAKTIKYIPHPNYNYLQRGNSIVSSNTLDNAFYKICSNISKIFEGKEDLNMYREIINVFFIERTIDMLDLSIKKSRKNFIKNLESFYENNKVTIDFIKEKELIQNSATFLTKKQVVILTKIYNNLYDKKYKNVKKLLKLRIYVNWIRRIIGNIKNLFKTVFGGIYE